MHLRSLDLMAQFDAGRLEGLVVRALVPTRVMCPLAIALRDGIDVAADGLADLDDMELIELLWLLDLPAITMVEGLVVEVDVLEVQAEVLELQARRTSYTQYPKSLSAV